LHHTIVCDPIHTVQGAMQVCDFSQTNQKESVGDVSNMIFVPLPQWMELFPNRGNSVKAFGGSFCSVKSNDFGRTMGPSGYNWIALYASRKKMLVLNCSSLVDRSRLFFTEATFRSSHD